MQPSTLQGVADAVVRQAQRQGSVVARDIRIELKLAGLPEEQWKKVVALAGTSLSFRQGRYYHVNSVSPRLVKEQELQRTVKKVIRQVIKEHRDAARKVERRGEKRVDFIQPVKVHAEGGKTYALLSRDLSPTGICILGTKRLLGQKVQVDLSLGDDTLVCRMVVRILWTCSLGDDLFENGGTFLEVV